jgi:hypothetical protein
MKAMHESKYEKPADSKLHPLLKATLVTERRAEAKSI